MKIDELEQFLGLKCAALIAGALGGVVQLALNPKLSIVGAAASVFAGSACAGYLGPAVHSGISAWVAMPEGAVNFLVGLLGMQGVAKIYAGFAGLKIGDIVDAILRVIPKRPDDKQ